jgi:hypothetical protein
VTEQQKAEPESMIGRKNIYVCEKCFGHIVTVDRDSGTTPMFLGCHATAGCDGMMQSSFYRVWDQSIGASHEWYRPTEPEKAALDDATLAHVEQFGLLIRPTYRHGHLYPAGSRPRMVK